MLRKTKRLVAATAMLAFSPLLIAQNFSNVNITRVAVNDQLSMLQGAGGNIGLFIGEDGTFLIDDQFAPLTAKIIQAAKDAGGDTPKFLINTHHHSDHSGGNENLGKAGALIISQDNARDRIRNNQEVQAVIQQQGATAALPVITFSKDISFHLNGDVVHAFHVPKAHTDGDIIIHFEKANVMHAGDVVNNLGFPFIDVASGGSLSGMIWAVERILEIADDDTQIMPGHGPLLGRAKLEQYLAMLKETHRVLEPLSAEKIPLERVLASNPLAHLHAGWNRTNMSTESFTSLAYQSLLAEP